MAEERNVFEPSYRKSEKHEKKMCKHCESTAHTTLEHRKHHKRFAEEKREEREEKHMKHMKHMKDEGREAGSGEDLKRKHRKGAPSLESKTGSEAEIMPNRTTRGNNFNGTTPMNRTALGGLGSGKRVTKPNEGDQPSLANWRPTKLKHRKAHDGDVDHPEESKTKEHSSRGFGLAHKRAKKA